MGNFLGFFNKMTSQVTGVWAGLSVGKRVGAIAGVLAVLAGIVALAATGKKQESSYLFVDVSPEDQQAIITFLKNSGFTDFVVDARGIKVPDEHLANMRIKLAQEGLPSQGQVGWEKFDSTEFTRTEFEQNINRLRAIQGELARTIRSVEGVQEVRVHIVMPKKTLFTEDQKEPSAAIYIKTKRGAELDKRQIFGIQHLAARSVEGLKAKDVAIIDSSGKMLTEIESDDESAKMNKERMAYKKELENRLEQRVKDIVGKIVGAERVDAKIDATIDFTQETQTISDVDPDKSAVLTRNTTGMQMQGTGLNPTGIPGSKSNVPGEAQPLEVASSRAENKRDSELISYEVSKVVSERKLPVGNLLRLTAAVIVDGKQEYAADGARPDFEARSTDEMKQIEDLVKRAIGAKDGRDEVTVQNVMFQLDTSQMQVITEKKKENKEYISTLVISATVALSLILFFAFVVRPYFRWLSYDPDRKKAEAFVEEFKPDLDLGTIQDVKVQEEVPFEKLSPKEQVLYLARHEPKRTTEAIKMLLNPHHNH